MASPIPDPRPPEGHTLLKPSKPPGIRTAEVGGFASPVPPYLDGGGAMASGGDSPRDDPAPLWVEEGLGVLCAEAQADGVPCEAPDSDCDECEHALRPRSKRHA